MAITAADVKKLRDLTGAGMMDCKKALEEADGDFDKAVELLRIKGGKKAAKRGAEREASAGLVATSGGALVELNCETDFVAKNDDFISHRPADRRRRRRGQGRPTLEALKAVALDGKTVGEVVEELAITHRREDRARPGRLLRRPVRGLHAQACRRPAAGRRRAGRVRRRRRGGRPRRRDADRRDAAAVPHPRRGPADVVEKERSIAEATAREEGKPEQALAKIVEGRLNGFFKDVVLLEQPSVTTARRSVKAVLDDAGVEVKRFARFEVGA